MRAGATRPLSRMARAATRAGTAATMKTVARSQPSDSNWPPTIEPRTEPARPTAFAQLTPVARLAVGQKAADNALMRNRPISPAWKQVQAGLVIRHPKRALTQSWC